MSTQLGHSQLERSQLSIIRWRPYLTLHYSHSLHHLPTVGDRYFEESGKIDNDCEERDQHWDTVRTRMIIDIWYSITLTIAGWHSTRRMKWMTFVVLGMTVGVLLIWNKVNWWWSDWATVPLASKWIASCHESLRSDRYHAPDLRYRLVMPTILTFTRWFSLHSITSQSSFFRRALFIFSLREGRSLFLLSHLNSTLLPRFLPHYLLFPPLISSRLSPRETSQFENLSTLSSFVQFFYSKAPKMVTIGSVQLQNE